MSETQPQPPKKRGLLVALVVGVFALVAVGAAALLANIAERKEQAKHAYVKLVELTENDVDPDVRARYTAPQSARPAPAGGWRSSPATATCSPWCFERTACRSRGRSTRQRSIAGCGAGRP